MISNDGFTPTSPLSVGAYCVRPAVIGLPPASLNRANYLSFSAAQARFLRSFIPSSLPYDRSSKGLAGQEWIVSRSRCGRKEQFSLLLAIEVSRMRQSQGPPFGRRFRAAMARTTRSTGFAMS
jgi:hypothetical protein